MSAASPKTFEHLSASAAAAALLGAAAPLAAATAALLAFMAQHSLQRLGQVRTGSTCSDSNCESNAEDSTHEGCSIQGRLWQLQQHLSRFTLPLTHRHPNAASQTCSVCPPYDKHSCWVEQLFLIAFIKPPQLQILARLAMVTSVFSLLPSGATTDATSLGTVATYHKGAGSSSSSICSSLCTRLPLQQRTALYNCPKWRHRACGCLLQAVRIRRSSCKG